MIHRDLDVPICTLCCEFNGKLFRRDQFHLRSFPMNVVELLDFFLNFFFYFFDFVFLLLLANHAY